MGRKKQTDKPAEKKTVEPFTDTHEKCAWLDRVAKIIDAAGNIIEEVAQGWRHGKEVKAVR